MSGAEKSLAIGALTALAGTLLTLWLLPSESRQDSGPGLGVNAEQNEPA